MTSNYLEPEMKPKNKPLERELAVERLSQSRTLVDK